MKHLILGMGQIGSSVHQALIKTDHEILSYDPLKNSSEEKNKLAQANDIVALHITFPYTDKFIDQVKAYQQEFKPEATVVYSTVQIGTCKQLPGKVFHSPVVGRHPNLYEGIMHGLRWIGTNGKDAHPIDTLWEEVGVKVKIVDSTDATEFIKIRSTSKFAINLVWTDYEKQIADDIGMDFEILKEYDRDYNRIYQQLGMEWAQQYILDPPNGEIGGHCVMPNAKLLNQKYPSDLLDKITTLKPKQDH